MVAESLANWRIGNQGINAGGISYGTEPQVNFAKASGLDPCSVGPNQLTCSIKRARYPSSLDHLWYASAPLYKFQTLVDLDASDIAPGLFYSSIGSYFLLMI